MYIYIRVFYTHTHIYIYTYRIYNIYISEILPNMIPGLEALPCIYHPKVPRFSWDLGCLASVAPPGAASPAPGRRSASCAAGAASTGASGPRSRTGRPVPGGPATGRAAAWEMWMT